MENHGILFTTEPNALEKTPKKYRRGAQTMKYLRSLYLSSKMYEEIDEIILKLNEIGFDIDSWSEGMRFIVFKGLKIIKKQVKEETIKVEEFLEYIRSERNT